MSRHAIAATQKIEGTTMSSSPPRRLAVILHADVVDSTTLVQRNETLAHEHIRDAFVQFSQTIDAYGGLTLELRGDALLAEFARASDAVCAALAFQLASAALNDRLSGEIQARFRPLNMMLRTIMIRVYNLILLN
ncbi:MAG: class 3 adenylate cyclase [Gammaproteobacteria bacterium]|jgi:class 3 adenylate cyclase